MGEGAQVPVAAYLCWRSLFWSSTLSLCDPGQGVTPAFSAGLGGLKLILGAWNRMSCCVRVGMNPGHGFFCLFHPWEAYFVPISLSRPASLFLLIFLFIAGVDELAKG